MCPPLHFDVVYRINPWMRPDGSADRDRALCEWTALRDALAVLGHQVTVMPAEPQLPDLVFAANGGIAIGERALVPRFRHRQRAPEAEHFANALRDLGIREVCTATCINEGKATSG